jgi:pilus assembly protein Flp/PilA
LIDIHINNQIRGIRMKNIVAFMRDEEGLTTVEYAIAGGLVSAAVIAAFTQLGGQVSRIIDGIGDALATIATP